VREIELATRQISRKAFFALRERVSLSKLCHDANEGLRLALSDYEPVPAYFCRTMHGGG
jgi:hypothetical protein